MKKAEYIAELKRRLANFSPSEVEDAVSYCEEYFEEAGNGNDQQVIDDLGTPAQFAAQLKAERSIRQEQQHRGYRRGNNPNSSLKNAGMIILGICALPIALPLLIAAIAVMFALVITVFALGVGRSYLLCLYPAYRDSADGKCCYKLSYTIQCMDSSRRRLAVYRIGNTALHPVFFTDSYRAACIYQCTDTALS